MAQAQWTAKISLTQVVRRGFLMRARIDGIDVVTLGARGRMAVGLDRSYTPERAACSADCCAAPWQSTRERAAGNPCLSTTKTTPTASGCYPVIGGVGTEPNAWVLIGRRPYPPREVSADAPDPEATPCSHHAPSSPSRVHPAEAAETPPSRAAQHRHSGTSTTSAPACPPFSESAVR